MISFASASVSDSPFFRAGPVVIVFSGSDFFEDDGEAPIAHNFVLLENVDPSNAGNDLNSLDGRPVVAPFEPISRGITGGFPFEITGQPFGGEFTNNPNFQVLDSRDTYSAFGLDRPRYLKKAHFSRNV